MSHPFCGYFEQNFEPASDLRIPLADPDVKNPRIVGSSAGCGFKGDKQGA